MRVCVILCYTLLCLSASTYGRYKYAERPVCMVLSRCKELYSTIDEYFYTVDDVQLQIVYSNDYFYFQCSDERIQLNNDALPRFELTMSIEKVMIINCKPPNGSYADAFGSLNIKILDRLDVLNIPFEPPLQGHHFEGLEPTVNRLTLSTDDEEHPLTPDANFMDPLNETVTILYLTNIKLTLDMVMNLPVVLETLHTKNTGLKDIPSDALARLSNLKVLELDESELRTTPNFTAATSLDSATLKSTNNIELFGDCGTLQRLEILWSRELSLPEYWLQGTCSQLKVLQFEGVNKEVMVPEKMLAGATNLRDIRFRFCNLNQLPEGLFNDTRQLVHLDLSRNHLTYLPKNIFTELKYLETLDLSFNDFTAIGGNSESTFKAIASVPNLKTLYLEKNPLGDLCDDKTKKSHLSSLSQLQTLVLKSSKISHLCSDWRDDLTSLTMLNLENNAITELKFSDLQWGPRANTIQVNLEGNFLKTIELSQLEYELLNVTSIQNNEVIIKIDSILRCDCKMYWFSRALQDLVVPVIFTQLICGVGDKAKTLYGENVNDAIAQGHTILLRYIDKKSMVCEVPFDSCATDCKCIYRASDDTTIVNCKNLHLKEIPRIDRKNRIELNLAANNITTLLVTDVPEELQVLDLSSNRITYMEPQVVDKLFESPSRQLRIADNPLTCDCDNEPLFQAIQTYSKQVLDYYNVTCVDGDNLVEIFTRNSTCKITKFGGTAIIAVIIGAVAILVIIGLYSAVRYNRLKIQSYMLSKGLFTDWMFPDDDDKNNEYDVFISYAHQDFEYADKIISTLESGENPLRFCVHHRDWTAGDWIPAQIARSVKISKRTLILLSENFVKSSWARAEFLEAHNRSIEDSCPRLIVIVLGDTPPKDMDPEFNHYIENNTYLKWDDPIFWDRLKMVLPYKNVNVKTEGGKNKLLNLEMIKMRVFK